VAPAHERPLDVERKLAAPETFDTGKVKEDELEKLRAAGVIT